MSSIRVFLVVVILAVITLFYFVAALRGFQSSMEKAEQLFDRQLQDTARLIARVHTEQTTPVTVYDTELAFQIWSNGRLLAASRNAPDSEICALEPGFGFSNFGGYRWRTVAYPDDAGGNWTLVAERTDMRYTLAENVILESLFPALAGLPVVGLLIWLIVSAGLRPLRQLAHTFASKRPDDLSPVSVSSPRQELAQIVASSNGLLARLESSLRREIQFASDAAHELRTPISALKLQVYNLAHEPGVDKDLLTQLEQSVIRLGHTVEQILDLYRSEPDRYNAPFAPIDLGDLAREVLAEEYPAFDARQQQLEFVGEACIVFGDRFALQTLLRNLLSNARKFTPRQGSIQVTVSREGHDARLVVEDSGPGIEANQRETVFERFYRGGQDGRSSGESGCGLGLAIVKRLVDLHQGRIEIVDSTFGSGAAFRVWLPLAQKEQRAGQPGRRENDNDDR